VAAPSGDDAASVAREEHFSSAGTAPIARRAGATPHAHLRHAAGAPPGELPETEGTASECRTLSSFARSSASLNAASEKRLSYAPAPLTRRKCCSSAFTCASCDGK